MEFHEYGSTDFLAFGQDLVEARLQRASSTTNIDFDGLLDPPLVLHEDLAGGCGGQLWPAGMVLAKYLLRHQELVKDKTIIEIGAGGGLVGLAVALASRGIFKAPLYLTDQLPMLALMKQNIAMNKLTTSVQASIYNWGESVPSNLPEHPDVILAADCVYYEPAFPLLLKTLEDMIGDNTVCYFCFKKRRRADIHFIKDMKRMFEVVEVEDNVGRGVYSREGLFLYRITK